MDTASRQLCHIMSWHSPCMKLSWKAPFVSITLGSHIWNHQASPSKASVPSTFFLCFKVKSGLSDSYLIPMGKRWIQALEVRNWKLRTKASRPRTEEEGSISELRPVGHVCELAPKKPMTHSNNLAIQKPPKWFFLLLVSIFSRQLSIYFNLFLLYNMLEANLCTITFCRSYIEYKTQPWYKPRSVGYYIFLLHERDGIPLGIIFNSYNLSLTVRLLSHFSFD